MSAKKNTYQDILRSSSIIGGAQALNYLVAMVRVKIIAVLLGPAGIGLVGLYQSLLGLVGTVSGLGISSSGVREVALVHSQDDMRQVARTVIVLRRACWVTGLLGWALSAALAVPLSQWVFGDSAHAMTIALLGVTLLLGAICNGQTAFLQGIRRIGDLARLQVVAMLLNTVVAITLYVLLRERGILPVMVVTAGVSLICSWWFARRVALLHVELTWAQTWQESRRFAGLGLAFMWSALLVTCLEMFTRSFITRLFGLDAAGYYQAAWALSGMFAGFVMSAMGTDFYPRLTALNDDPEAAVRAVNDQTEVGVYLVLPGLLATLSFAPEVLELFYSEKFKPAAELIPFLALGVLGRVVSFPMGFIQLAKGAYKSFVVTQTIFEVLTLVLIVVLVPSVGLVGAAYAYPLTYLFYTFAILWIGRRMIGFRWSPQVKRLLLITVCVIITSFGLKLITDGWMANIIGGVMTIFGTIFSLRSLTKKLEPDHRIIRMLPAWFINKK
jgi:PST family polysaccharide transporter